MYKGLLSLVIALPDESGLKATTPASFEWIVRKTLNFIVYQTIITSPAEALNRLPEQRDCYTKSCLSSVFL